MARRIILGLVVAGILALIYVGYKNWSLRQAMLSGQVTGGPEPEEAAPQAAPPATANAAGEQRTATARTPPVATTKQPAEVPTGDTISPQPPNGTVFAGTGRFQVYRQGNLTWRLDTDTGRTCILFATDEEWRKPRVYQNGCGSSRKR